MKDREKFLPKKNKKLQAKSQNESEGKAIKKIKKDEKVRKLKPWEIDDDDDDDDVEDGDGDGDGDEDGDEDEDKDED